jgi:hypothetical protein
MDMDRFLNDGNVNRLRQLAGPRITASERIALLQVLDDHFVNAQKLGKYARLARAATTFAEQDLHLTLLAKEERKRVALEGNYLSLKKFRPSGPRTQRDPAEFGTESTAA